MILLLRAQHAQLHQQSLDAPILYIRPSLPSIAFCILILSLLSRYIYNHSLEDSTQHNHVLSVFQTQISTCQPVNLLTLLYRLATSLPITTSSWAQLFLLWALCLESSLEVVSALYVLTSLQDCAISSNAPSTPSYTRTSF